ncbi:MAG TPA: hypothetical protein VM345_07970 [Acidimicrobiales bacterium]|nr:hypothetical protein [Acidimicrobiales bacterium]
MVASTGTIASTGPPSNDACRSDTPIVAASITSPVAGCPHGRWSANGGRWSPMMVGDNSEGRRSSSVITTSTGSDGC